MASSPPLRLLPRAALASSSSSLSPKPRTGLFSLAVASGSSSLHPVAIGTGRNRLLRPLMSAAAASCSPALSTGHFDVGVGDDLPEEYGEWFPKKDLGERRRVGVLLHPTSLQGPYGIGDLGDEAIRFLDWLHAAGCSVWQVLPLVPPGRKSREDGSPYAGQDANCGNTLLISLEQLVKDGLLTQDELPEPMDPEYVDFTKVAEVKDPLIAKTFHFRFQEVIKAAERLILSEGDLKIQFEDFRKDPEISGWLEDAALFAAIDNNIGKFAWNEWPEPLKNRYLVALEEVYQSHKDFIDIFVAQQFLFQRQWQRVRNHAKERGIKIMGDMPIYVGHHSADVWANRKLFMLDRRGFPTQVSGVPPDAFSETGQLWGRF
ncbi:hypothetical protein Taro_032766 [Colocasia esculenta]|uniref:4-alpha-glucanotransferase n=1 Tax=Colocasia esculenta TaxID=4460 RepID=A0A843VVU7_COLES|nr:hypothetical protein [Colocasia esculenta]